MQPHKLLNLARTLATEANETLFRLGNALVEIKTRKLYLRRHDSWWEYTRVELGMSEVGANELVDIAKWTQRFKPSKEQQTELVRLGRVRAYWALKGAKYLSRLDTWTKRAKKMTVRELQYQALGAKGDGAPVTRSIYLHSGQNRSMDDALSRARSQWGDRPIGELMTNILEQWIKADKVASGESSRKRGKRRRKAS